MEQDGSNPIRINCVILNFNDGETVSQAGAHDPRL